MSKVCQIFKVDISQAFRHVPIDPGDLGLLGLGGLFSGLFPAIRVQTWVFHVSLSDGMQFITSQEGHQVRNFIDDFLCVSLPSKIARTYARLQELSQELGLIISTKKLKLPATRATCLGIVVNTENLSVSITVEIVAKCIKFARFFLIECLPYYLKISKKKMYFRYSRLQKRFILVQHFLSVYTGVTFFQHVPSKDVHLYACPRGLGAIHRCMQCL